MNAPDMQRTTSVALAQTPERAQILQLLERIGTQCGVDSFSNANGHCVVASCVRADGRSVRFYVDGAPSVRSGERIVLAAMKVASGGEA